MRMLVGLVVLHVAAVTSQLWNNKDQSQHAPVSADDGTAINARARISGSGARGPHEQVPILAEALEGPAGVGRLPALGWNSWNAYGCNISEAKILDAAKLIVDTGLKDAGYTYVNIDDCWSEKTRDASTNQLKPDLTKFPYGISGTADKIHAMGLKIGIYSSAGTQTCAGYPASIDNEELDAQTWADWGIDYLKYDNCNIPSEWKDACDFCIVDGDNHKNFTPGPNGTCPADAANWCPTDYDWSKSKTAERYARMRDAILKTGRPILYSLCEWGEAAVQTWGNTTAQSWRSTGDITPSWPRIKEILNENSFYMNSVDFHSHSDADMLELGNGLSPAESRTHFTLWAAMKSPLLIGTDLSRINAHDLSVLRNRHLLAFHQDEVHGESAKPYKWGTNPDWTFDKARPAEYWAGRGVEGVLVVVVNTDEGVAERRIDFGEVPGLKAGRAYEVVDVWGIGEREGCFSEGIAATLEAHDVAAFVVGKEC